MQVKGGVLGEGRTEWWEVVELQIYFEGKASGIWKQARFRM